MLQAKLGVVEAIDKIVIDEQLATIGDVDDGGLLSAREEAAREQDAKARQRSFHLQIVPEILAARLARRRPHNPAAASSIMPPEIGSGTSVPSAGAGEIDIVWL